jgi:hypothetical protein
MSSMNATQHTPAARPAGHDDPEIIERAVHGLLIAADEQRPWSLHELELEIGEYIAVVDAVRRLQGLGLLHRCGDFVWATRAALAI